MSNEHTGALEQKSGNNVHFSHILLFIWLAYSRP